MYDSLTLILPIHNGGDRLGPTLRAWSGFLQTKLDRSYDMILVDDGSTDGAVSKIDTQSIPHLRVLSHEKKLGFGACLRSALAQPCHPIVGYVGIDYPYDPADLTKLLKRLGERTHILDREMTVESVSGCRTGRPVPAIWKFIGRVFRVFSRVAIGGTFQPLRGWLGFREHAQSWFLWLTMGVPLEDVHSTFKLFRRSLLDRFPIQSHGDFVHAEIFAKLTFLGTLLAEEPLTPAPDPLHRTEWSDFWTVFTDAKFHSSLPDLTKPALAGV